MELINPVRYVEPLAPLMAARRNQESTTDVLQKCQAAYAELARRHEIVIVEGVGGWMVPLAHESTFSDCSHLVDALQLPIVTVSRRVLGTINHSLLTWRAIAPRRMLGWIFCDAAPVESDDVAANTSPALISEISELPIIAQVPYIENLTKNILSEAAQKYFCS